MITSLHGIYCPIKALDISHRKMIFKEIIIVKPTVFIAISCIFNSSNNNPDKSKNMRY